MHFFVFKRASFDPVALDMFSERIKAHGVYDGSSLQGPSDGDGVVYLSLGKRAVRVVTQLDKDIVTTQDSCFRSNARRFPTLDQMEIEIGFVPVHACVEVGHNQRDESALSDEPGLCGRQWLRSNVVRRDQNPKRGQPREIQCCGHRRDSW